MTTQPPDRSGDFLPPATENASVAQAGFARRAWKASGRKTRRASNAAQKLAQNTQTRLYTRGLDNLRGLGIERPGRMLGVVRPMRALFPRRLALAQAEALLTARSQGWDSAAPLFARIAEERDTFTGDATTALLRPDTPAPALDLATPAAGRPTVLPADQAARVVIYTTAFGAPRALPPLFEIADRLQFVCFSDQDIAAPGWRVVPPAHSDPDPRTATARHKMLPHEVLAEVAPGAEFSLFLAPDTLLVGNPDTLLARWLLPHDLVMWRHECCIDWHDMSEHHLIAQNAETHAVLAQAQAFEAAGLQRDRGAVDTGMLWRRHGDAGIARMMERWWQLAQESPGPDDLNFYRLLHDPAEPAHPHPRIMPERLGTAGDNIFIARDGREQTGDRDGREQIGDRDGRERIEDRDGREQTPARSDHAHPAPRDGDETALTAPAAPAVHTGKLPVAFLYAEKFARSASTFLRGEQLSAMIAQRYPERYEVTYTSDADALRDRAVIVTKGALEASEPEALEALRRRNIVAVGCWDDVRPDPDKARRVDAHMTLSNRQKIDLERLFPQIPAFFVTHHVNPQVQAGTPPMDRLRTGYFGELANTVRPESLARMVTLVGINTRDVNDTWLTRLPDFNCHWIVRRSRSWDGWKPFLKGFVAARCGAVIVVTRDDGDAQYYLGDDYPFYARSLDTADLEMALVEVAGAFGGPDWDRAQAIMKQVGARNSPEQVCAEFDAMLGQLTA